MYGCYRDVETATTTTATTTTTAAAVAFASVPTSATSASLPMIQMNNYGITLAAAALNSATSIKKRIFFNFFF